MKSLEKQKRKPRRKKRAIRAARLALLAVVLTGCSDPSLRVALETQRRADEVQQFVFDGQHEAIRVLLYRDLVSRLEADGDALSDSQRSALSDVWNERDLAEFWVVQNERAKGLRVVGVDAKLWSDQSAVDLILKSLSERQKRVGPVIAEQFGKQIGASDE